MTTVTRSAQLSAALPDPALASQRLEWLSTYITRARVHGEVPYFGSATWLGLPDTDPRKVGAVCIAAEAWAIETDPATIRQRAEDELTARRQVQDKLDAEDWHEASARVVSISTARRRAPWEQRERDRQDAS